MRCARVPESFIILLFPQGRPLYASTLLHLSLSQSVANYVVDANHADAEPRIVYNGED
jgi:hypothetical protein